ncbi:MAG: STAS domain-containing protein [Deltaproteobacteria bacterium]|nr:STAS domain-containing protein [Deltaproteobacteria bacterium]
MFEIKHLNDVLVMNVTGDLERNNYRQFDSLLDQAMQNKSERVVLDLSGLAHIDYKLVPHLVERVHQIEKQGGEVKWAGGNDYISNIFKFMGFEEEVYPSVEDAVISFAPISEDEWQ